MKTTIFAIWFCLLGSPLLAHAEGRLVSLSTPGRFQPGSIVIMTHKRALYFVLNEHHAIRYPVAVPKRGQEWSGYARVTGKFWQPPWSPPAIVKRDNPHLPDFIPGGAPNNPMGTAAIALDRSEIAIHGSTKKMRKSIGTAASYGCIRMLNEDVADLYRRIDVGTLVLMVR